MTVLDQVVRLKFEAHRMGREPIGLVVGPLNLARLLEAVGSLRKYDLDGEPTIAKVCGLNLRLVEQEVVYLEYDLDDRVRLMRKA